MTHLIRYDNLAGKIAIPQLHLTRPPTPLYDEIIPLYTHPVKEHFEDEPQAEELHEIMQSNAELTDEEIGEMMGLDLAMQSSAYMNIVNKVKAILRKAQKNSNIFCKHGYDMSKCKCPKCETGIY